MCLKIYPYKIFQVILYKNNICIDLILKSTNYLIKLINLNEDIRLAVNSWCTDTNYAKIIYGHISLWDVSRVTDMSYLFSEKYLFNNNINSWDVSNVNDMRYMFHNTIYFNQPLESWNTSQVTNMSCMFYYAKSFNQPLDNWDISNVENTSYIFSGASSFNQPSVYIKFKILKKKPTGIKYTD